MGSSASIPRSADHRVSLSRGRRSDPPAFARTGLALMRTSPLAAAFASTVPRHVGLARDGRVCGLARRSRSYRPGLLALASDTLPLVALLTRRACIGHPLP